MSDFPPCPYREIRDLSIRSVYRYCASPKLATIILLYDNLLARSVSHVRRAFLRSLNPYIYTHYP